MIGQNTLPWVLLGVFAVFWVGLFAFLGPLPGGPDVFVFRDAGCNLAQGRGLVAVSVPHANTVVPRLFASYTPGAPILFALVASVFDCSAPTDTFYNLAFAAAAAGALLFCFCLRVRSGWHRACAAVLIGATLPTGMVALDADRPEMPAFCLLAIILLLWEQISTVLVRTALFAGLGIVFLVHPFAGIVGWLLLIFLLIFSPTEGAGAWSRRLQMAILGSVLCALIVAAWAVWMWTNDHGSLQRFLQHAAGKGTGAGVVLHRGGEGEPNSKLGAHNGYAVAFRQLFDPAFPSAAAVAVSLLLTGAVIATSALRRPRRGPFLVQCVWLLAVLLLFPIAVFPAQTNYLGLSRALLLVMVCVGKFPLAERLRTSSAPLILILIAFASSAPWVGLEILQTAEARSSYYQEHEQAKRVRTYFERHGIDNPALLVDSGHYFLYKPFFTRLYNPNYVEPGDETGQIQGVVACYAGSRAFSRAQLPRDTVLTAGDWNLIDGGEDVLRVTVFGHPVMRRNWTWMCDVYARK